MWPLPDQDEVNRLMTWQYGVILKARRGLRFLWFALAALLAVALILNPSWNLAAQFVIGIAVLAGFDLMIGLFARFTLSFVEKDKRP